MIEIVRRDPVNLLLYPPARVPAAAAQVGGFESGDRRVQEAVLFIEQLAIPFPRRVIGTVGTREPVGAVARECDVGVPQEPAAAEAFPIGGVEHQIPAAVTLSARTPPPPALTHT